jgi:ribosome biogenesis GTPase
LRDCFPELRKYQLRCQFPDCTHDHEPGCVVFDAVERGEIPASRYASYVEMLDELKKAPEMVEDVEPDSDP